MIRVRTCVFVFSLFALFVLHRNMHVCFSLSSIKNENCHRTQQRTMLDSLPFDCLFDIVALLDLRTLGSLLLTCRALHSQLTLSHNAHFIWMNQLNHFLVREIDYLSNGGENHQGGTGGNYDAIAQKLSNQLKNQKLLLQRYELRAAKSTGQQDVLNNNDNDDDNDDDHSISQYRTSQFAYNSLKQMVFGAFVRKRRTVMGELLEQMNDSARIDSMSLLFQFVDRATTNNDLSPFKYSVRVGDGDAGDDGDNRLSSGEHVKEVKRVEAQELALWSLKRNKSNIMYLFLKIATYLKDEWISHAEMRRRVTDLIDKMLHDYRLDMFGEATNRKSALLFIMLMGDMEMLDMFIPLYNQRIVKQKQAQRMMLYTPGSSIANTTQIPVAFAVARQLSPTVIDILLERLYEPNRSQLLAQLMNTAFHDPVTTQYSRSLLSYDWTWVRSALEKYRVDVSRIPFASYETAAVTAPAHCLDIYRYLVSMGVKPNIDSSSGAVSPDHESSFDTAFMALMGRYSDQSMSEEHVMQCIDILLQLGGQLTDVPVFSVGLYKPTYSERMCHFLVDRGANVDHPLPLRGCSFLLHVLDRRIYGRDFQIVRWLLDCGADPHRYWKAPMNYSYHLNALRMVHSRHSDNGHSFKVLLDMLAEYGVTRETQQPDPDGLTFDEWLEQTSE